MSAHIFGISTPVPAFCCGPVGCLNFNEDALQCHSAVHIVNAANTVENPWGECTKEMSVGPCISRVGRAADIFNTGTRKCVGRACLAFAGGATEILGVTPTSKSWRFHGFHALQRPQHFQCSLLHVYCTSLNFNRIAQDMQACLSGRCQNKNTRFTARPGAWPGPARTPALPMELHKLKEVMTLAYSSRRLGNPPSLLAESTRGSGHWHWPRMMTLLVWAPRGQVEPGGGGTKNRESSPVALIERESRHLRDAQHSA